MRDTIVRVAAGRTSLDADLSIPRKARGVVLFAHGGGSSRRSPRNRQVAKRLRDSGFATMLADLLTPDEERRDATTGAFRFDIDLLAERLAATIDWLLDQPSTARLPIGLFGASTGAAAALEAASRRPAAVRAVVSRGGAPDLADGSLPAVRAPTLLIVGGRDEDVLELNELAAGALPADSEIRVVPGATHLFDEPGALEQVAEWAAEWFDRHLAVRRGP